MEKKRERWSFGEESMTFDMRHHSPNQPTKTAPKKKVNAAKLTHIKKQPPVQRRSRNFPLPTLSSK